MPYETLPIIEAGEIVPTSWYNQMKENFESLGVFDIGLQLQVVGGSRGVGVIHRRDYEPWNEDADRVTQMQDVSIRGRDNDVNDKSLFVGRHYPEGDRRMLTTYYGLEAPGNTAFIVIVGSSTNEVTGRVNFTTIARTRVDAQHWVNEVPSNYRLV